MKKSDFSKTLAQAAQAALHTNEAMVQRRRQFLAMVAKSGISASLLKATPLAAGLMASRFAQASGAEPKRVIFLYFPGGAPRGTWMPTDINTMNLSTQAYKTVAKHCNFYQADLQVGGGGQTRFTLTGPSATTSLDVHLSEILGTTTPFSRIHLSVLVGNSLDLLSRKNSVPIRPIDNPQAAYDYIFGGAPNHFHTKQNLALEANLAGLNAIKSQLNADEKLRLETHADAIAQLQKELENTRPAICDKPILPSSTETNNDIGKTLRLQMDVAIAAFQCNLTNVASIQFSTSDADWIYKGSFTDSQHNTAHGYPLAKTLEIQNYLGSHSVYLLERLMNSLDSNGKKLIDSTVFVQVTGEGDLSDHSLGGAPFIVASKIPTFKAGTVGLRGNNVMLYSDIAKGLGITSLTDFNSAYSSGILV